MSFKIITIDESDRQKWAELIEGCDDSDIFFARSYCLLFNESNNEVKKEFGSDPQMFFFGNENNYIIYPFFRRKINNLPFVDFLPSDFSNWVDIISPYGYSGPLAHISEPDISSLLWQEYLHEFHKYCTQEKIIAEFTRLHPFIQNHQYLAATTNIKLLSTVVYVDLKQDASIIKQKFSRGNKSAISKAIRSEVTIVRSKTVDEIDAFYRLYTGTMKRVNAKVAYFFPREFFLNLFKQFGENAELFYAKHNNKIIAAAIILCNKSIAHYFLGGTDSEFLQLRPNNLLFYEIILWAKKEGYEVFNLGGGYSEERELLRFKSSFAKTTRNFYIYNRIHNEKAYQAVCEARNFHDSANGISVAGTSYFPAYRR